jgi:hypothetical protein
VAFVAFSTAASITLLVASMTAVTITKRTRLLATWQLAKQEILQNINLNQSINQSINHCVVSKTDWKLVHNAPLSCWLVSNST